MPVERAPRLSRAFVAVFLGVFALCGLLGIEAWPLTGWHPFSRLRSDHQVSWQAIAIGASGGEQEVRFGASAPCLPQLPAGHEGLLRPQRG